MVWGAWWEEGPARVSGDPCARAPGAGGWLRRGAQALHCTRSGHAEVAPRCALQWSAGNAARVNRDIKLASRGPGGVPGKDHPGHAPSFSVASPYPLHLLGFSLAQVPLWGCLPRVLGFPPSFPSSALVFASAQRVEQSGQRVWLEDEGQGGPRTWEGRS